MVTLQLANRLVPVSDADLPVIQAALDVFLADRRQPPRLRKNPSKNHVALSLYRQPQRQLQSHFSFGDVERCVFLASSVPAGVRDVSTLIVRRYGRGR